MRLHSHQPQPTVCVCVCVCVCMCSKDDCISKHITVKEILVHFQQLSILYVINHVEWNPSTMDTIGEQGFGCYRGVALTGGVCIFSLYICPWMSMKHMYTDPGLQHNNQTCVQLHVCRNSCGLDSVKSTG